MELNELAFPLNGTKAIFDAIIEKFLLENPHGDERQVEVCVCKIFKRKTKPQIICQENGIDVLRLPPYHCLFNPIEDLWGHVKRLVREWATPETKLEEIRNLTFRALSIIGPEMIAKFYKHVENTENDFRTKEGIQEHTIPPFIIPLDDELDDSESDEEIFDNISDDDDFQ